MGYTRSAMSEKEQLLAIIDRFAGVKVVLCGDLVLDRFILGSPKRISREAPVIILRHEAQRDIPGGGGNALANVAGLGARVTAVAVVGDDEPGAALRTALAERAIDDRYIVTVPAYRTPTKVRILGGGPSSLKHQVARYDIEDRLEPGGAWREQLDRHLAASIVGADAVAISDYGYGCAAPEVVSALISAADGQWTCLDSRYRIGAFAGVSGATPNLEELETFCGRRLDSDAEVAAGAEQLRRALGARFVLATRGNRGMTLAEARGARHIPVFGSDEVADVTGAGDTVLAVLTVALAAGAEPFDAARLANLAAGLAVMKLGTATVSSAELHAAAASAGGGGDGA